jgi:hypothetical protein
MHINACTHSGEKPVQDKSFVEAIQDLQDRLSSDFQKTLSHILVHRTTVAKASLNIQDEKVRAIVKNTLITGQMITLLTLIKEMGILDETQYDEFAAYLMQSLTYQLYNS